MPTTTLPIVIVGGGLAGLTAAAIAAQKGHPTLLLEKASSLGGRGTTQVKSGFHLNIGPHALYKSGHGTRVLAGLGITPKGNAPKTSGGHAVAGGSLHVLPGGAMSLLTTSLLGASGKLEVGKLLGGLARIDPEPLDRITVDAWLTRTVRDATVRQLLEGLFRLTTYVNAPTRMSAGAAIRQLQGGLSSGVLYLDGGWQTLVDELRSAATRAGATIIPSARVLAVAHEGDALVVRTADGSRHPAAAVVIAADPDTALEVVGPAAAPDFKAFVHDATPVHAACLDVALSSLPRPRSTFALGIDRPLYLSVHSAAALLAPAGHAMIHVAAYLPDGEPPQGPAVEHELEGLLDLVQPGWRTVLVHRRFLPHLAVVHAIPTATMGGLAGRPAVDGTGLPGVLVAGDWVGARGFLVDASFASAERAAALAVAHAATRRAAA